MNKTIKKDFKNKLTKKDYFLYLLNRNSFLLITPIVILALITGFIYSLTKDGFQASDLLYLLPNLLFVLSYLQVNTSINKAIESNKKTTQLTIAITDKEYSETTGNGSTSLGYEKFYCFYESKEYFYLYVDKLNALILPKREFNEEEISTIRTYFSNSIRRTTLFNLRNMFNFIIGVCLLTCIVILIISMF